MTIVSRAQPIDRFNVAAGLLVLAAVGHALAIPHHADPGHGGPEHAAAFATVAAAQLLGAAAIARRPTESRRRVAVVAGSLLLIALWAVSRAVGLPYGPHPGEAEAIGTLDASTVVAQLGVVGLLVQTGRPLRLPMTVAASVAVLVVGLAAMETADVGTPAQGSTSHHEKPAATRPHPTHEHVEGRSAEPAAATSYDDNERDGESGHSHPDAEEHTHP